MKIEKLLTTIRSTIIYVRSLNGEVVYTNQPLPSEWQPLNEYEAQIVAGLEAQVFDKARDGFINGARRTFSSSYSLVKDEEEQVLVVVSQDITSRVYVEKKIKHAVRDIEHTFRNAASTAKLSIANFQEGDIDSETLDTMLQMAEQRFEDAEKLIVAINRGRITKIHEVYVNEVFKTILLKLANVFALKNITIVNNISDDIMVLTNEPELSVVAADILNNAIVHGGANITINLRAVRAENKVKIFLENSGPKIPESKLQYIFSIDCPSETGMGFGLFSARQKITDHGGNLSVKNTDQGPCFEILLPTI